MSQQKYAVNMSRTENSNLCLSSFLKNDANLYNCKVTLYSVLNLDQSIHVQIEQFASFRKQMNGGC